MPPLTRPRSTINTQMTWTEIIDSDHFDCVTYFNSIHWSVVRPGKTLRPFVFVRQLLVADVFTTSDPLSAHRRIYRLRIGTSMRYASGYTLRRRRPFLRRLCPS